ncbi:MAG TPA: alpha/beta hydrolase [Longilinea sp.]|nr:alpha/beta hydrolase [Longilinea sp.]
MPIAANIAYVQHNGAASPINPVVLIHGAGADHTCWPIEIRHLQGLSVLAIDLPNHGHSAGCGDRSIAGYAQAVLAWMDTLNLWKVSLVGHSMGGAIALYLAQHAPERVIALGLLSTAGSFVLPQRMLDLFANTSSQDKALDQLSGLLFTPQTNPLIRRRSMNLFTTARLAVLASDWILCRDIYLDHSLAITAPTYIASGRNDRLIPPKAVLELAAHIPQAQVQLLAECGHLAILEKPVVIAAALTKLLQPIYQPWIDSRHVF